MLWLDGEHPGPDRHAAFRGTFELTSDTEIELRAFGASWFVLWLDGELLLEGPARFPKEKPQYEPRTLKLPAGRHVLAAQVHYLGVETRILQEMRPFLDVHVLAGGAEVPVNWRCQALTAYAPEVRRINPELGWVEWCDTRALPEGWQQPAFDDGAWPAPVAVDPGLGPLAPLTIGPVQMPEHALAPIASGPLAHTFGYERDDIPARFFLRDLVCEDLPPGGVWRRYDLGKVRLGRPCFTLDLPAGAVVEFAYSETLAHGRVQPYITLSAGASCNLDHYVARGGEQTFFPLTPRGGRFMEIHILAPANEIRFVREAYVERTYWLEPEGAFQCKDEDLNRIWTIGVESLRSCAEDALTDNPTRERGQWTGDVVTVGQAIASVSFSDMRLFRRALLQSAECAREDGMVAGLCPGGVGYLSSYAAQWTYGCLDYHARTGDLAFLEEAYDAASNNIAAFERFVSDGGLVGDTGWAFIDWGFVPNEGPSDMALNMHFLASVRGMRDWCARIGRPEEAPRYEALDKKFTAIIRSWLDGVLGDAQKGAEVLGYHRGVLALTLELLNPEEEMLVVEAMKAHMLNCFPNNPDAPRNDDPTVQRTQLITPYFAHYALPALIERGEMDFVLDQYRTCWGYMMEGGRTTWIEVFDTRWSHCHQWGGCPTWQLSHYALGLKPMFHLGARTFDLVLQPGALGSASGRIPLPDGDTVEVSWTREGNRIAYTLDAPEAIRVNLGRGPAGAALTDVSGRQTFALTNVQGLWRLDA